MFRGIYGRSQKQEADLNHVLDRAWDNGMEKMIVTVGTLNDAKEALELVSKDGTFYLKLNTKFNI